MDILYLAKPQYGGWVTFTAHLALGTNSKVYIIGRKSGTKNFGYGIQAKVITENELFMLENIIISALDKNYIKTAMKLKNCSLVLHDPTELKSGIEPFLKNFTVITIREAFQKLLKEKYHLNPYFIPHPFYQYQVDAGKKTEAVCISRIDYDKNIHIILEANKKLKNKIKLWGAENPMCVFQKGFKQMGYEEVYMGEFEKSFDAVNSILKTARFVVDMSTIKGDGGGTQYTFLEAINAGCALILNKKWVEVGSLFRDGVNCFVADNSEDLARVIENTSEEQVRKILQEANKILSQHNPELWNGADKLKRNNLDDILSEFN